MEVLRSPRSQERDRSEDRYADRHVSVAASSRVDMVLESVGDAKPLWRGDHTFSKDAAKYSLEHFIEPEVAKEHPHWTADQVRDAALETFKQRLSQDLGYEQHESAHRETAVTWRVVETAPGVSELATEYGGKQVTLKELWEHTKEFAAFVGNPAAYNEAEERAQLAMQSEFVAKNADAYVSVLSHPDSVRYIQVWERGDTGEITSKQVDLYAATGADFSADAGHALVSHIASLQQQKQEGAVITQDISYSHFFVKDGHVDITDIKAIARMQQIHESVAVPQGSAEAVIVPVHSVIRDTADSLVLLGNYLRDSIHKKTEALSPDRPVAAASTGDHEMPILPRKEAYAKPSDKKETKAVSEPQAGRVSLPAESHSVPDMLAEWFVARAAVRYMTAVPEQSGGALYLLRFIVSEPTVNKSQETNMTTAEVPVLKKASGKERVNTVRKKDRLTRRLLTGRIRRFFERISFTKTPKEQSDKKTKREGVVRRPGQPAETSLSASPTESLKERVTAKTAKRIVAVWNALRTIVAFRKKEGMVRNRRGEIKRQDGVKKDTLVPPTESNVTEPETGIERLRRETVSDFAFSFVLWRFLVVNEHEPERKVMEDQPTEVKEAMNEESAPQGNWLLFAIIWYLAMLREQGHAGLPVKKKKTKKTRLLRFTNEDALIVPVREVMFTVVSC